MISKKKKKILQVINTLGIGGAETLIKDLSILLNDKHDVTVFILGGEDTFLTEQLKENNIKVIKKTEKIRSIKNLLWLFKNIGKYDIIHSHLSYAQYLVAINKIFHPNKVYVTTEHSTFNRRQGMKIFKWIEYFVYSCYDKIIVISQATEEALMKWQPSIKNKVVVIENGINLLKFKLATPLQEFCPEEINIVMTAAFRHEKDQDTLIRSLTHLPPEYILYLVGDGDRKADLTSLVHNLNLESRVHFLGIRNDVEKIYKSCDIFILSSHWEGFGLVAIEAMASGLPVIASNVSGLAQVVGKYGVLFEPGNHEQLASKILELSRNQNKKDELIKQASVYSEGYDIKTMTQKYMNLYEGRDV